MESLNPENMITQLEHDYLTYMNAPVERRGELAAALRRSIRRSEIEIANVRNVDTDYEQRKPRHNIVYFCGE
jgi:hypothetical protein